MKKTSHIVIFLLVIMSLLVSGCKPKAATNQSRESGVYYTEEYDFYADEMMADMAFAAEESSAYSKAVPAAQNGGGSEQKRMIQKSASIQIQVMDPIASAEKLITLTEQMGGFVVTSSNTQERYSGDIYLPRANLTIRVPAEKLNETLEFIENMTGDASKDVSNKRIYGVDITSDYVDTSSRLTSLEKTRDKLYEILETAQNAEEALEVYQSIADVESEIEVYKGQIKYMEESVALSSIEVTISSIRPAPISTVTTWSVGDVFKDAFESLLDGCKSVIELLIYFLIAVVPILILAAIPIVIIVLVIRKLIRSKKEKSGKNKENKKNEDVLAQVNKE